MAKFQRYLLIVATITVACTAAYFSIYGLSLLFSGAFFSVLVMASALELGKFSTASYLHVYWSGLHAWMRSYMLIAIFVLMGITSMGIFGFLSNAYQKSSLDIQKQQTQMSFLESQRTNLVSKIDSLDTQIILIPENTPTAVRQKQIQTLTIKKDTFSAELDKLNIQINTDTQKMMGSGVEVGPLVFLAKVTNKSIDEVVTRIIVVLICVFDPLAVCLVLALGSVFQKEDIDKKK